MLCGFGDLLLQSSVQKKKNNKDSTEIRKTIKDSDKIGIF